jgi:hypothetical protein
MKKAFIKTIEILLVIVFTTIFLMALLQQQFSPSLDENKNYLSELEENQDFRAYLSQNTGCFDSESTNSGYIRQYLPQRFDYTLCIGASPDSLPNKEVYVNSMFFSGNMTETQLKKIRLYYWVAS